jgi:ribosomal RNA assembly protein
MKELIIKSARKIIQNKKELEDKLNVKIFISGVNVEIKGNPESEYFAERVISALDFPFLVEDALLLKSENFMFEVLSIKDFTKRHDFSVIKGRLIGTKGKTLRVLENLSNCEIAIRGNSVAIIGPIETFSQVRQAVISLIQGSKQGHVYGVLEKRHKKSRKEEYQLK